MIDDRYGGCKIEEVAPRLVTLCFTWNDTSQGEDFWRQVHAGWDKFIRKEMEKPAAYGAISADGHDIGPLSIIKKFKLPKINVS